MTTDDTNATEGLTEAAVIAAISTVYDPEIPVNIYELGLIYRVDVLDDGAVEEWDIQTTSVTSLRRAGWGPDTLTLGETVRVWGDLGHGDSRKLFMRGMEKADGSEHLPSGPVRSRSERNRVNANADIEYG